ncbi:MAG: hypothetical protein WBB33_01990 [Candidatus Saccharimonadales bacterium]
MPMGARYVLAVAIVCIGIVFALSERASAQTLASPNYRFDESTLGAGGMVQSGSPNYNVTSGLGDIGIGNSASTNYQINSGSHTPKDPYLTFRMISSTANFDQFSATTTSYATSSFSVANYTTFGYVVQIFGDPPSNASHTLAPMTTTSPSQVGIEQFGLNLVANTSPASFGANPNNGQFGFGSIMPQYSTPNEYRYVAGDTVAKAEKDSGETIYTVSYIVNVTPLTAGGQYTSNQTIIVTGTY